MSAIFRYPGGKFRLALKILEYLNVMGKSKYVEPFCGGASVAIEVAKRNSKIHIVLNDIDEKISGFWKTVISDYRELADKVSTYVPTVESYVEMKNKKDALSVLVRNRCSHSGKGGGPIGGMDQTGEWKINARWNKKKLSEEIIKIGELLSGRCEVLSHDGITLISELDDSCIVYLDPPYMSAGKSMYEKHFTGDDHQRLREILGDREEWVLSYDKHDSILKMYLEIENVSIFDILMTSANHDGGSKKQTELLLVRRKP